MADYSNITTLAAIDTATPAGSEAGSALDDAIRQLKYFCKNFLAVAHTDAGALKAGSAVAGSIAAGTVRGSTANSAGTAQEISQGTISTPDFRAGAVDATALATDAVTTAKILAAQVTTAKIAASAVTATELATGAVTTAKVAANAITGTELASHASTDASRAVATNHIKDANVTTAKIADLAVTAGKIATIGAGKLLVGDTTGAVAATVGGALTMTLVGTTATFVLAGSGLASGFAALYCIIKESYASGTNAGASVASTWTDRTSWTADDPGSLCSLSGANITIKATGDYLIRIRAPGYSCGSHKCKLYDQTGTQDLKFGSSAAAPPGVISDSFIDCIIHIGTINTQLRVKTWAELSVLSNGLGLAVGSGDVEIYTTLEIIKLS